MGKLIISETEKKNILSLYESTNKVLFYVDKEVEEIINMISNHDYERLESLPADNQLVNKVISLLQNPKNKTEKDIIIQMSCNINESKIKNTFLSLLLAASSILGGCGSDSESPTTKNENIYNKGLNDFTPDEAREAANEMVKVLADIIYGENHNLNLDSSVENGTYYEILNDNKNLQRTDKEIIKDYKSEENYNKLRKLGYPSIFESWEQFLKYNNSNVYGSETKDIVASLTNPERILVIGSVYSYGYYLENNPSTLEKMNYQDKIGINKNKIYNNFK
jgi:hypothetical protein